MTQEAKPKTKRFKERRIYFFTCAGRCGKKRRQSLRRSVARAAKCKKCRRQEHIEKHQHSLFGLVGKTEDGKTIVAAVEVHEHGKAEIIQPPPYPTESAENDPKTQEIAAGEPIGEGSCKTCGETVQHAHTDVELDIET